MTAGTVVITGGILAAVILLFIIAVLCYCRLQYYCCKHNGSDPDSCSFGDPQAQFACNACSAPGVDGPAVTPLCLPAYPPAPPHSYCPTCSPYAKPFYILRNGPAHYENRALSLGMSAMHAAPLSSAHIPAHIPLNSAHIPPSSAHIPLNSAHIPLNSAHIPPSSAHTPLNSAHIPPSSAHIPPSSAHMPSSSAHIPPSSAHGPPRLHSASFPPLSTQV